MIALLTYFWPMFAFYTPRKHQKTFFVFSGPMFPIYTPWNHQKTFFGFLVFLEGIKWEHWPEINFLK